MVFYTMNIRPATTDDLEGIVALTEDLLENHLEYDLEYFELAESHRLYLEDWVKYHLGSISQFILVSEITASGKKPVLTGYISGYIKPLFPWFKIKQVGHLSFLAVDKRWRRKGVGNLLEEKASLWFKEKDIKYIEVYTNEKNFPGLSAWTSYGYKPFNRFLRKSL